MNSKCGVVIMRFSRPMYPRNGQVIINSLYNFSNVVEPLMGLRYKDRTPVTTYQLGDGWLRLLK